MSVTTKGPDADAIRTREIVTQHARAHDLLDQYGVPRMDDAKTQWLSLTLRIEVLMTEIRELATRNEDRSVHVGSLRPASQGQEDSDG